VPIKATFTKKFLDSLTTDPGKRLVVRDDKVAGLQLRVTGRGVKTFSIYRRMKAGGPERITLGRYPTMTIETARKRAASINNVIEGGANPAESKRALRAQRTFAELFAEYLERHAMPRKRTWQEDKAKYERHIANALGPKKLSAIGRTDVAAVHSAVTKEGHPITANRVLALVSSIYGWALSAGLWENNPAKGIRKNAERSRDRFLQPAEVPRFYSALAAEPNKTLRDYFLISLLTGARRANVLAMKWDELDLARGEWRIPRTKNNNPQLVPLTPEAVTILRGREAAKDEKSAYVFPGTGKHGHLVEPKLGWKRILDRDEVAQIALRFKAAGKPLTLIPEKSLSETLDRARAEAKRAKIDTSNARMVDLRIHDLRRTLGSWQARTGASLSIIGKSLNHKSVQTTAIYSRLDIDPVRESVERATSAILVAAGAKPATGKVRSHQRMRKV
jgi:integrase